MSRSREELADLVRRGYRFAYSLTHEGVRAEDLVQDAWVAVLRARGPWTIEYLIVAIRSRFTDLCRRDGLASFSPLADDEAAQRELRPPYGRAGEEGEPNRGGPQRGPDESWIDGETLDRALERLRPEERAALYLSAVEGRSAQDIGELLGWPRGTVLSLVHRARHKLRAWLPCGPGART